MSTELKTLKGKFHSQRTDVMESIDLSLTRFSGGAEGMKLQMALSNTDQGEFFTHITLNVNQIKNLIKELQENFEL